MHQMWLRSSVLSLSKHAHFNGRLYCNTVRSFQEAPARRTGTQGARSLSFRVSCGVHVQRFHLQSSSTLTFVIHLCHAASRQETGRSSDRPEKVAPMEVEVKVRLPDKAARDKVHELLKDGHVAKYAQENFFFDGTGGELASRRVVLRVRLYNHDEKATITIKGQTILQDGIGKSSELEESIDPKDARRYVTDDADALLSHPAEIIQSLKRTCGLESLRCLGGFLNERNVFNWEGETLELDETKYDWGTLYEIEVESVKPEEVRSALEAFLSSNGISYSYSKSTKFANFINKSLL